MRCYEFKTLLLQATIRVYKYVIFGVFYTKKYITQLHQECWAVFEFLPSENPRTILNRSQQPADF